MNKLTKTIFAIGCCLMCAVLDSPAAGPLTAIPTFESCGLYLPYEGDYDECHFYYRQSGTGEWQEAYPPVYDGGEAREFRGSVVRLTENTDYMVRAEVYRGGERVYESGEVPFTTWRSNVPVATTYDISRYKTGSGEDAYYLIDGVKGSPEGWIKITSSQVLDLVNTKATHAIQITNSHHVILEGLTLIGGAKNGISIENKNSSKEFTASDIRIVNCDISGWGRASKLQTEKGVYVDDTGAEINYDGGVRVYKARNVVVERCYIHDCKGQANAWTDVVKDGPHAGKEFKEVHPKGPTGMFIDRPAGGIVLRYNDVIGSQTHRFNDVVETAQNGDVIGGFTKDCDIYGNMLALGRDDGIELDGGQCNTRMYGNRVEQVYCGISTAPNRKGPSYLFNNVVWNLGDGTPTGRESVAIKNGGGDSHTQGRTFFFNNTMVVSKNVISGVGYGNSMNRAKFYATTRNNILVSGRKPSKATPSNGTDKGKAGDGLSISDREQDPANDFDYDLIGNTATSDGKGQVFAVVGSEAQGVYGLPKFTDRERGVFTFASATDKGTDKGVVLPNFTGAYQGKAPDMGAFEYGASSLMPVRPLDIEADRYLVDFKADRTQQQVRLTVGAIGEATPFRICKSADMTWVNIRADHSMLESNSTLTLTLEAGRTDGPQVGVFLVRLPNGLSVPITVKANISTGDVLTEVPSLVDSSLLIVYEAATSTLCLPPYLHARTVTLFDLNGRLVWQEMTVSANRVPVNEISAGVYIVRVEGDEESLFGKVLIR